MSPQEVRLFLNQVERETIMERGYGSHSFAHSLVKCLNDFRKRRLLPRCTNSSGASLTRFPLIPSNSSAACRRRLHISMSGSIHVIMMTKGDFTEQKAKVERSGLRSTSRPWRSWRKRNPPYVSRSCQQIRACSGVDVDDRQQPAVRY